MPPIKVETVSNEGSRYAIPILGDLNEKLSQKLDISALEGTGLVDSDGYLIPGAVLRWDSSAKLLKPIDGGGQTARGIVLEAVKVAEGNTSTLLDAASDFDVVIVVGCTIDRGIAEYNLDRAYTANELTAFGNNDRLTLTDPES